MKGNEEPTKAEGQQQVERQLKGQKALTCKAMKSPARLEGNHDLKGNEKPNKAERQQQPERE